MLVANESIVLHKKVVNSLENNALLMLHCEKVVILLNVVDGKLMKIKKYNNLVNY